MEIKDYVSSVLASLTQVQGRVDFELHLDSDAMVIMGERNHCNIVKFSVEVDQGKVTIL